MQGRFRQHSYRTPPVFRGLQSFLRGWRLLQLPEIEHARKHIVLRTISDLAQNYVRAIITHKDSARQEAVDKPIDMC